MNRAYAERGPISTPFLWRALLLIAAALALLAVPIRAQAQVVMTPPPGALPPATGGTPYTQTFSATGGTGPYIYSLFAGALPPGLALSSAGLMSGTPTAAGFYTMTIRATDSLAATTTNTFTLQVLSPSIAISPSVLADGVGGQAFTQMLSATGGAGPYTFSLTAGTLPPGIALSSAGIISGTPTTPGLYNLTVRATDAFGFSGQQAFSFRILAPTVEVSPTTLANGVVGVSFLRTVTASGGTGPYTFSLTSGALPIGVSFNSAGQFSGTPRSDGTFNLTVRATDTFGFTGAQAYAFIIVPPTLTMTPATLPGGRVGAVYTQALGTSGGVAPHTYSLVSGALPPGVALSSAGQLSGTPVLAGSYTFVVRTTDDAGYTAQTSYTVVVAPPPTITVSPAALPDGAVGQAYSQSLTASGGTGPYSFSLLGGALPIGVSFSSAGQLSGVPRAHGAFSLNVRATDADGFTGSQIVTLNIPAPTLTTAPATLLGGQVGIAYNQSLSTSGGIAPYTYSLVSGSLPVGVAFSSAGQYSGVPTTAGSYTAVVRATDDAGYTVQTSYTILVAAAAPLMVTPASLPAGTTGTPYSQTVTASGGTAPYSFSLLSGALPPGLSFSAAGVLSGTPTAPGAYAVTLRATDAFGTTGDRAYTIVVNASAVVGPPITVEILQGQTATVDLTAAATGGPFTAAAVVGVTPADSGATAITNPSAGRYSLTYTPAASFSGTATVTYTLSNAASTSAPGTVTVIVVARPDPSLDPEVLGLIAAQDETARRFAAAQTANIAGRLEALRDGAAGRSSLRLGFRGDDGTVDLGLDPSLRRDLTAAESPSSSSLAVMARDDAFVGDAVGGAGGSASIGRLGVWAAGVVDFGRRDDDAGQPGAKFTTDGLTAGMDYRAGDAAVLGVSVGYGRDETRVGDNGTRSEADGYSIAVYGGYRPGGTVFVDGVVGYGSMSFESRRYVTATGGFATGERDGDQWFAAAAAGWVVDRGGWSLSPYGRLATSRSVLDAFSETGGGPYALAYDEQVVRSTTAGFGLRGSHVRAVRQGELSARFRLEYSHEFEDADRAGLSYLDWIGGPSYEAVLTPFGQDRLTTGLGLGLTTLNGWRLNGEYQVQFSDDGHQQQVRLQAAKAF